MNFARLTALGIFSVIPFGLFMPRSEAIMNKEYIEWKQSASIDLIAMGGHSGGCHGGGGNSLKKRSEKAALQAELKDMVDELKRSKSKDTK